MKHFLSLTPDQFTNIDSPFLTLHKSTYSSGDELVISMEDHREQVTLGISKIITEKVNKHYCYLCLTGIDDIKDVFVKNLSQAGEGC